MAERTHYVGRVVIEAVTLTTPETSGRSYDADKVAPRRSKHTVASFTIAAEDVETLTQRIGLHLGHVEDGGDTDV